MLTQGLYIVAAQPSDPPELSFSAGEVLEILGDKYKQWWNARNASGTVGSKFCAPFPENIMGTMLSASHSCPRKNYFNVVEEAS